MINIYCDESCHLENDRSDIMLLGAISCDKKYVRKIAEEIRELKVKHGLGSNFEIKWTKVSPAKESFYASIMRYFFEHSELQFRCVIIRGKSQLNNEAFHQTYDEWYYKMYYLLLSKMLDATKEYSVFIDIKDTCGGCKAAKLKEIINNFLYSFSHTCLRKVQIVKSHELELLQLCDLLIGAVGYYNRFMSAFCINRELSLAKADLCNDLTTLSSRPLDRTTPLSETKFNLFVWEPR